MEGKWQYPWTAVLGGATGSGKSCFVQRLIKHIDTISDTQFARIILHYSEWQDGYKELGDRIEFHESLPELSDYACDPRPKLLIVDDLMHESSSSDSLASLFTKGSHHRGFSIIYITQNIFHQGKGQREISLNAHYMVVFRNLRDRSQIQHLARQLMPESPKFLQEAYWNATSRPYGVYKDIELLVTEINELDNIGKHLKFKVERGGYVSVERICTDDACLTLEHTLQLSRRLRNILGSNPDVDDILVRLDRPTVGIFPGSLANGLPNMLMIYADICEPYYTGSSRSKLLKVVPLDTHNYAVVKMSIMHHQVALIEPVGGGWGNCSGSGGTW
ncbi:hypothetical protein QAD02_007343 [Eretmocerus hayati]|uniref:Uncharacterized protein n=1 Tax=Eretmocerus hayati TaxID=131215 RepID=A0ACC2N4Q6_9HYME|nr:hypothetical protein QAD02_007343 [Eretmocerus hayati]